MADFRQIEWDERLAADCRALARLAFVEDLAGQQDWTTVSLVPADRRGAAQIVAREPGVVAGIEALQVAIDVIGADLSVENRVADGDKIDAGAVLAQLQGNVRDLLTAERTLLNLLSRLMGIATLASRYVAEAAGTKAHVYDTRKTTSGWRRLEKYAARCGGARNHRMGLYDAVLIKDNHLAQRGKEAGCAAEAVMEARKFLEEHGSSADAMIVEVEVDTIQQLSVVLSARPDIVLLDNMSLDQLREAVRLRDEEAPQIELEASGNVSLKILREIAATGVERISVGALTHSARSLDIGLDLQS
ncbi:MAG: carboxylating nicotinate-nucleotide diphosphorylase [Pirellulales bacterium]|nr:carboxylating nicotinate-nucleotide diphosphorylase [Pirellulales bacterium]